MSTPLADAQRELARYLRDPDAAPAPPIEARRLQVYRDLVYRNIEGFIRSGFPVLRSLYDDEAWEARVRGFIRDHRCETPLFLRISEEFVAYLGADPAGLRPFEAELAHYEWLELAVDVSEGEPAAVAAPELTPAHAAGELAPTARLASYRYPVHRIGRSFQPETPGEGTHLLVYRARSGNTEFMELNAATARLLLETERRAKGTTPSGAFAAAAATLAKEWGMDLESLTTFAWQQLMELNGAGAVRLWDGTR